MTIKKAVVKVSDVGKAPAASDMDVLLEEILAEIRSLNMGAGVNTYNLQVKVDRLIVMLKEGRN